MNTAGMGTGWAAAPFRSWTWMCGRRRLEPGRRTLIMGVLNVTPDSFSDGGRHADPARAVERGLAMVEEGADVLDVGGESTRPGARAVPAAEEIRRVVPVIAALRARTDRPISVDTRKAHVAREALAAGADLVNDISALGDPAMAEAVAASGAGIILMHMQGTPSTMQESPRYGDVVGEVGGFLSERYAFARACGIADDRIALDPGIGFGKTPEHNLALLAALDRLPCPDRPILVGVSRKSIVGHLTGRPVGERAAGSLALLVWAILKGAAVVRVHDVKDSCDAARVADKMRHEDMTHGLA